MSDKTGPITHGRADLNELARSFSRHVAEADKEDEAKRRHAPKQQEGLRDTLYIVMHHWPEVPPFTAAKYRAECISLTTTDARAPFCGEAPTRELALKRLRRAFLDGLHERGIDNADCRGRARTAKLEVLSTENYESVKGTVFGHSAATRPLIVKP